MAYFFLCLCSSLQAKCIQESGSDCRKYKSELHGKSKAEWGKKRNPLSSWSSSFATEHTTFLRDTHPSHFGNTLNSTSHQNQRGAHVEQVISLRMIFKCNTGFWMLQFLKLYQS